MNHHHLRELASHWRELAEIGDPLRREHRRKWAEELERMADMEESRAGGGEPGKL